MRKFLVLPAVLTAMLALPFGSAAVTSPAWNLNGEYTISLTCTVGCPPGPYVHEMNVTFTDLGAGAVAGSGFYVPNPGYTWDVTGTVSGSAVALHIVYTGISAGYWLDLAGTIAADGTMSGASTGDSFGRAFDWVSTTGAARLMPQSISDCSFGTYPKSALAWSSFAPAVGTVVTSPTLETTRDYFLEVSGTYFAGGSGLFDIEADAEYSQDAVQRATAAPWTDFVNNYAIYGEELLELLVDGVAVEWGAYNASHRYTLDVVPTGLPLDISANIYDTYAVNNTGGLCVALFYEDDTGPITSAVALNPPMAGSGAAVTVTANVDDTTTGGSNIKSAEFSVDGGIWTPMTASDGGFDEIVEDVTGSFTAPLDGGSYQVCVRGTDDMDNTGAAACTSLTIYDAYARISGTNGPLTGRGGSLAFSYQGWVATAGGDILGQVSVNYRTLRQTCVYTPDGDSGLSILNGIATLTGWQSSCPSGEFNLTLWDRDLTGYSPRGYVLVNGPGTTYDIGIPPTNPTAGLPLETGNVHVVDLTAGTVRGTFSAADSLYYNGPTSAAPLYGTGPITFSWVNGVVTGGFWDEVVPPTTGTTYYNIVAGTTVVGNVVVNLTFTRTLPAPYGPFFFTGTFTGNTLIGFADGPFLFIATGNLIVS